jgi:hypothetical protein
MKCFRWSWTIIVTLSCICLATVSASSLLTHAATTSRFYLQTMDSCRQAIPGSSFVLTGHGLYIKKGPAPGTKPVKVANGSCLIQRGNCVTVPTGCLSWTIPVPSTGTRTYRITEKSAPPNYVFCVGGSVCSVPDTVTLTINSDGVISATVKNVYPNGQSVVWPTSGAPYTGRPTDPAVAHNSALGSGNCDGDQDADDHTTGSEGFSPHCDNDTDRGI